MEVQCQLESCDGHVSQEVVLHTTRHVTGNMRVVNWAQKGKQWPHLADVKFPSTGKRPIVDMLIGIDLSDLHCALKEIRGAPGEPVARLTPLGWTCVGLMGNDDSDSSHFTFFIDEEAKLSSLVKHMWEIDEPEPCAIVKPSDKEAERIVTDSLRELPDGYMVGLPWKLDGPELMNNYAMASSRLKHTENRLKRQPDLGLAYKKVLEDYTEKGYVRCVKDDEPLPVKMWYLPHFPVVRPHKETTKVRIVFDASSRYQGTALNDALHQGPKLQNDLVHVLLRFRRYPIALVTDIAEMYLQVHVQPQDRPVQRFLWRNLEDIEPQVYEFSRVVFGVNASPYLAQYVARYNADRYKEQFPRAAETVKESTYMDDSMDSALTVDEAIKLYHELVDLWKKAGMKARKWISNSAEVLKVIPSEECVKSLNLDAGVMPMVKTLGVSWKSDTDCFTFEINPPDENFVVTKRSFLSKTATLFDPLGFVTPFTIRARILLQEMWSAGIQWDQEVPEQLVDIASQWFKELPELSGIIVPRALQLPETVKSTQLHVFVDASEIAYGAIAYLRQQYDSGEISIRMVMSKAKVTPLQAISIPRLELMSAIVGVRIAETVGCVLHLDSSQWYFWSDNKDVLYWVRGQ